MPLAAVHLFALVQHDVENEQASRNQCSGNTVNNPSELRRTCIIGLEIIQAFSDGSDDGARRQGEVVQRSAVETRVRRNTFREADHRWGVVNADDAESGALGG